MVLGEVWGEGNEFRLFRVSLKAVPGKPLSDFSETFADQVGGVDVCNAAAEYSTIVDVYVEATLLPCRIDEF